MNTANGEPAANSPAGRTPWREAIGSAQRNRRPLVAADLVAAEFLLILLPFPLRALGSFGIPCSSRFSLGGFSCGYAARGAAWDCGTQRVGGGPILLGTGIGIAYDAADVLVFLPAIHRLTGQGSSWNSMANCAGKLAPFCYCWR